MKIAPYTERWNEGERDWSFVEDPRSEIEQWEKRESILLPPEYRKFLLKFNGGSVYPRLFKNTIGPLQLGPYVDNSSEDYVDLIHNWKTVESHWRGEIYGEGVPPKHLVIASTPGPVQLLMSLNSANFGAVYSWVHSTNKWGTDGNTEIFPQAHNFKAFLHSLYDDQEQSDYESWHLPIYDKLARELDI